MDLYALLVPRDTSQLSRQQFFDRFISAGLEQHPSATQEPTAELREKYRFDLLWEFGWIMVARDSESGVIAHAEMQEPNDGRGILDWANSLFAVAHRVDADVFFKDPRIIRILAPFGKLDERYGLQLIGQPPTPWAKSFEKRMDNGPMTTWRQLIGEEPTDTFIVYRITDELCEEAGEWLAMAAEFDRTIIIDSCGGTITPSFYKLIEQAQKAVSVSAVAKKAHSAAALLFLAFEHRSITVDGEVVLKPQNISMSLKRAMTLTAADLRRYKDEYDRYSNLLKALLKEKSRVSDEHIALILDKEAALFFDAPNAVAAGLAEKILQAPGTATLHVVKTESAEKQVGPASKPFVIFPDA